MPYTHIGAEYRSTPEKNYRQYARIARKNGTDPMTFERWHDGPNGLFKAQRDKLAQEKRG